MDGPEKGDAGVEIAASQPKLAEPPKYAVYLHNDDYTTMEFVVEVLRLYFQKTEDAAIQVMLQVHHAGRGVAGIYSHDIAETKSIQVEEHARAHGFPLKCSVERT